MSDPLRQELLDIFVGRATRRYGLSEINQLQHALQSAALAEADGAPPATVLASLLHDVGHMIHRLGEIPPAAASTTCTRSWAPTGWPSASVPRSASRSACMSPPSAISAPSSPDYFGKLAPDSVRSLELQGGLMSADEVEAFRANPLHAEAVRLRRFDEAAKDPRATTPDFDYFLRHVAVCRRA